jgi:Condensation domain
MNGLVLADRVWVKFHGDRGGDGPMTLGQHNTIQWTEKLLPEHFQTMSDWVFQVPATAGVADVAAAWGVLISRHESLRTTYPPACGPDGWPVQRVAVSGEIAIGVYEPDGENTAGEDLAGEDPAGAARELISMLRERPFELDRELPVRVGVAVAAGGIRAIAAVYSHVAADFGAMAVIGRQFAELVADPVCRVAGPRGHQPLDQAEAERSDRGRKRAEAALEYWRYQLRRGPQCMFAVPESVPDDGAGPPPACLLSSPSAAMALPQITARTGASPAVVTLAALSAVLAHRTANRYCMLVSLASNRGDVRLRDYVGSLTQYCLVLVDVSTTRFDDLVRRAATASLRAHRHSLFDADELEAVHQAVSRSRGTSFDQDFTFNNLSAYGVNPRSWGLIPPAADVASSREAQCTLEQGTLEQGTLEQGTLEQGTLEWWTPRWMPPALLQIEMLAAEPALELALISGDTRRVPRAELTLVLRGIERLLVAAAADDPDLTQLTRVTGVEPVARDGDWLYIDSCWIELSATQRLVAEALPGTAPSVFPVRGPRGTPILAAYLVANETVRTPEQAHSACVRLLPGRHSVMAPGWYVLCASTPADPGDLTGWQHQPVLSNGNGRGGQAG